MHYRHCLRLIDTVDLFVICPASLAAAEQGEGATELGRPMMPDKCRKGLQSKVTDSRACNAPTPFAFPFRAVVDRRLVREVR